VRRKVDEMTQPLEKLELRESTVRATFSRELYNEEAENLGQRVAEALDEGDRYGERWEVLYGGKSSVDLGWAITGVEARGLSLDEVRAFTDCVTQFLDDADEIERGE